MNNPSRSETRAVQTWMLRVITHPDGVEPGFEAALREGLLPDGVERIQDLVPGNDDVDAFQQLHIYAYAYFSRQIEVMEGEYPTLVHLYGEDRFAALCRQYLVENPSQSYSLDKLSNRFAAFVRGVDGYPHPGFAADVALVERAMEELLDYAAESRIDATALADIPPDLWATSRLTGIVAFRVLELEHPVGPYMNAVRADGDAVVAEPSPSWMAVYRRGGRVWRMAITPIQAILLKDLRAGRALGEALESVALLPEVDMAEVIGSVGGWFQEWTAEGWFSDVTFDEVGS